jgi:hypothetical protein
VEGEGEAEDVGVRGAEEDRVAVKEVVEAERRDEEGEEEGG